MKLIPRMVHPTEPKNRCALYIIDTNEAIFDWSKTRCSAWGMYLDDLEGILNIDLWVKDKCD